MATSSLDQVPTQIQIVNQSGIPTNAFVMFLTKLINKLNSSSSNVVSGAGLNADGSYTADSTAHYINSATSLYNADKKLDTQIYAIAQRVVTITSNYSALVGNYSIIADATSGAITVILPQASTATAFIIGITKKDISSNSVIITRSGTDTIAGDISQTLLYDGEVLNFISDGINWQLAN